MEASFKRVGREGPQKSTISSRRPQRMNDEVDFWQQILIKKFPSEQTGSWESTVDAIGAASWLKHSHAGIRVATQ